MKVLVTGGAGYIGSHTCVELIKSGHEVIIVDNFSNSNPKAVDRIAQITSVKPVVYGDDLLDLEAIRKIFSEHSIDAVIHFAGLKAVGESVSKPMMYYHNNITGTLNLCSAMQEAGVKKLVFSSSATVYGENGSVPFKETNPLGATNPYGQTKFMIEQILRDIYISDNEWSIALLRYFNPIGAHESGLIGEDPKGIPNNLIPYVTQVCIGKLKELKVYGSDYPTADGTGVRDYIHVTDLADGHVKALDKVSRYTGVEAYNLGTGMGNSVLEVVHTFEKVSGQKIPYQLVDRRPGDIAVSYADPSKAEKVLGWKAERDLEQMLTDSWRWQKQNPEGYGE